MGSFAIILTASVLSVAPEDSSIRIDAARVENHMSRLMYGACIEDVNHEIYGGLYSQMIFGESFEEPPRSPGAPGWTSWGGSWTCKGGLLSVRADFGAKAVRDEPVVGDATISCDVRFDDTRGDNAGLILRVNEPRVGADAWIGYEISLSAKGRHLLLGRHRNDFRALRQVPANVEAGRWHRLKVELTGPNVRISLDGADSPLIDFTDTDGAIPSGRVGVRTWNSDAAFRNLVIERREGKVVDSFQPPETEPENLGLSGMWDRVHTGEASIRLGWDADRPYNTAHSQRLEHGGGAGTAGIANRGLNRWGLCYRAGNSYQGHVYLRQEGYAGNVTAALQDLTGSRTYAQQTLDRIGPDWRRFDFSLESNTSDENARFALWIDRPGKIWVDQVFLSGTGDELFRGQPMRGDIGRGLVQERLTILRYGGSMVNAPEYRWKTMIGPRDQRPQYRGFWYPFSTNGFGIEEFVAFCRAAGFEAVVAINIEETPEDAADLVEYLNGPATSKWGQVRAANGHAQPYGLRYIEIGNEEATNAHYIERFQKLYAAMRPRDANLAFIVGAWWEPDNPVSRQIVEELSGKAALWDVHVGGDDPREGAKVDALFVRMRRLFAQWVPDTPMKACVLEENGGQHNLRRALGHAGILNATQRHGDFVLIDCPANCLQPWHQNDNNWDQGQLFFTSGQVWGMPPYYAQQMAASAHLSNRIFSETKSPADDLDVTATRDEFGTRVVLKVVNAGDVSHSARIALSGIGSFDPKAEVDTLAGALDAINTPDNPDRVRSVRTTFEGVDETFVYEFPARSYSVLRLRRRRPQ